MRAMFLAIVAAVLLFSSIAQAQTGGACCYCGRGVKLTEEGAGFARDWVGFCGECQKEIGDIDAYLKKLQGQFRGLADAAKQTNARLKEKLKKRDDARDSIFGPRGSAVGFFKSLMSFAAEGSGAKWKNVAEYIGKGLDYYDKAAATLEGDFKWVWEDGKGWVQGKAVDKALLKIAAGQAKQHYAKTKDARGSTKLFLERHKQMKAGLSFLSGAKSLYDDGNELADGIQKYLEAREDSDRLYEEWDQLTEQMDDLLRRIGKLKHCRDGMNKQKEKQKAGKQSSGPGFAPAVLAVAMLQTGGEADPAAPSAQERRELKAWVQDENQSTADDLKKMLESLAKLKGELTEFQTFFEEEIFAPLVPFWVEVNDEMGPELSLALLKWARPNVEEARKRFNAAEKTGRNIVSYLRKVSRGGIVGSYRGYWLKGEAEELIVFHDSPMKIKGKDGKETALRLLDVDEAGKQARLWVGKKKEPVSINEGETRKFDLDEDGVEDVEVMVKKLSSGPVMVAEVKKLGTK